MTKIILDGAPSKLRLNEKSVKIIITTNSESTKNSSNLLHWLGRSVRRGLFVRKTKQKRYPSQSVIGTPSTPSTAVSTPTGSGGGNLKLKSPPTIKKSVKGEHSAE
ncbi:unnamed protein product [Ceratitis capitata]|uniref:(Mediterranean fruit fly) hypothetical protein n=1 Tax=Ceratitis capitata TaxID=7213 RepID=A0A811UHF8_CERCA|nr:unnamed protein product [Ceratitis capitata]